MRGGYRAIWSMGVSAALALLTLDPFGNLALAQHSPAETTPRGGAATYADRQQSHELCHPLTYDALVLPLVRSSRAIPPRRVEQRQWALNTRRDPVSPAKYLWKAYPWRDEHAEFVRRLETSADPTARYELLNWCEQHKLYDCAEFLVRRSLYEQQHQPDGDSYRWYLAKWKSIGAHQRRSPFTFEPPVRGQWQVLIDSDRHHAKKHWSVWAWDLVMPRDSAFYYGANRVENYFAWRQPVHAVADGVVVAAVDRFADHQTGVNAPANEGNFLQLDCGGGVYAYYGHLRQNSLRVAVGDQVNRGDILALVGNSGDSGLPHLHFTLMDGDGFSIRGRYAMELWTATGWQAYDGLDFEEGWHFREVR